METTLHIGIILDFDKNSKKGKLLAYRDEELVFNEKQLIGKTNFFNQYDIVGYYLDENVIHDSKSLTYHVVDSSISKVDLVENMTEDFMRFRGRFCGIEWALVTKAVKSFYLDEIKRKLEPLIKFYNSIEDHVLTTDFKGLIDNYKICVSTCSNSKIGGDDTFTVYLVGSLPEKYKQDFYLKSIIPEINERRYRDSGYTSWTKMEKEFEEDIELNIKLKQEAKQIEDRIKNKAKGQYDKTQHEIELKFIYLKKIYSLIDDYENSINNMIGNGWNLELEIIKKMNKI